MAVIIYSNKDDFSPFRPFYFSGTLWTQWGWWYHQLCATPVELLPAVSTDTAQSTLLHFQISACVYCTLLTFDAIPALYNPQRNL